LAAQRRADDPAGLRWSPAGGRCLVALVSGARALRVRSRGRWFTAAAPATDLPQPPRRTSPTPDFVAHEAIPRWPGLRHGRPRSCRWSPMPPGLSGAVEHRADHGKRSSDSGIVRTRAAGASDRQRPAGRRGRLRNSVSLYCTFRTAPDW